MGGNFARAAAVAAAAAGAAAFGAVLSASSPPPAFSGVAVDRDGRVQYHEQHEFTPAGNGGYRSVTLYRGADGREIARMEADYSRFRFAPEYRMVDHRFDHEAVVRRDADTVVIEQRSKGGLRSKTVKLRAGRELIIGPGFNEFIRAHWDRLLAGEVLACDFVIPSRAQVVGFRIQHDKSRSSAARPSFTVSVENPLLRLLAPTLRVEYEGDTRQLVGYEGPTHVTDDRDRARHVVIRFPAPDAPIGVTSSAQ